jgi:hypothetical protein
MAVALKHQRTKPLFVSFRQQRMFFWNKHALPIFTFDGGVRLKASIGTVSLRPVALTFENKNNPAEVERIANELLAL